MGEVYRARCHPDGRVVALKIEGDHAGQDPRARFRERFLREARILRELKHENLPQFFGVGEVQDGRVFIAMELLVGRPFTEFARQDLETLIPLFLQCARALKVTSEAGVVHRDVSPDNFFVVEVGGRSVVKLIDFGISRDAAAIADGLTRPGTFLGKLKYSSPEQSGLLKGADPVDWRTDLYSLGLTMYFLLLGRLPFPGSSPQEQFQARAKELDPEVFEAIRSERLRRLIAKMVRRSPESRQGSFDEVVAELLRVKAEVAREQASQFDLSLRQLRRSAEAPIGRLPLPAPPAAAVAALPRKAPRRRAGFETFLSTGGLVVLAVLLIVGSLLLAGMEDGMIFGSAGHSRTRIPTPLLPPVLLVLGFLAAALALLRSRAGRPGKSAAALAHAPRAALSAQAAPAAETAPAEPAAESAQGRPPGAHLVVSGDGPPRDVWLCGDQDGSWPAEIVIGRAAPEGPSSVRIASPAVSGLQARLLHQGGTFLIENLSRTNTTKVNGRPLTAGEKKLLAVGDRIGMGPVTISFHVS